MGRDIHAYIELREYKNPDYWTLVSKLYIKRWIALFGALGAGWSNEKPIIPSKGIPVDLAIHTDIEWRHWEGDAHHVSWLTTEEVMRIYRIIPNIPEWAACVAMMVRLEDKTKEPCRLIYWFDN